MKFSKRLASMLFEIYPDAVSVEYRHKQYWALNGNDESFIINNYHCDPPDSGEPTEYKREDVFVYGDEVEWRETGCMWNFIGYKDDSHIYVDSESDLMRWHTSDVRRPQPKEEMVDVILPNFMSENIRVKQIPLSKAKELGL